MFLMLIESVSDWLNVGCVEEQAMGERRQKIVGWKQFLADESGPTAVEYAVMLAFIIVACAATVTTLGQTASAKFAEANAGW